MDRSYARLLVLLVSLGLYAGVMWYVFARESDWTARQTWAVVLTGAILIWYTWETMQLRYAAHAQREAQIRPYAVLQPTPGRLSVTNFGNGVALHIRVETVIVNEEFKIEIRFPKADLAPEKRIPC